MKPGTKVVLVDKHYGVFYGELVEPDEGAPDNKVKVAHYRQICWRDKWGNAAALAHHGASVGRIRVSEASTKPVIKDVMYVFTCTPEAAASIETASVAVAAPKFENKTNN